MKTNKIIICPVCGKTKITKNIYEERGMCSICYNKHKDEHLSFIIDNTEEKSNIINLHKGKRKNKVTELVIEVVTDLNDIQHKDLTAKQLYDYLLQNYADEFDITLKRFRQILFTHNLSFKREVTRTPNKNKRTNNIKKAIEHSRINTDKRNESNSLLEALDSIVTDDMYIEEIMELLGKLFPEEPIIYNTIWGMLKRLNKSYKKHRPGAIGHNGNDDVLDYILTLNTEVLTTGEITELVNSRFPDLNMSKDVLRQKLNRNNIPYKKWTTEDRKKHMIAVVTNRTTNISEKTNNEESIVEYSNNEVNEIETNNDLNLEEPERFIPIREEINNVLARKFKQLKCEVERHYTTEDYIKMLEMLAYLTENKDYIIKARRDQHDIMNAYQSDIVHEQEHIIAQPGDTYLQDKLHILRKERRYYEHDTNDLIILKTILDTIDPKSINKVIKALQTEHDKRENVRFIPMIDNTMIEKYDWAVNGTLASSKINKPILTTNTKTKNSTGYLKINSSVKVFRASCKLSGGGYGVYKAWHRDYKTTTDELALTCAKADLEALAEKHQGMMYTNLEVHMLNT